MSHRNMTDSFKKLFGNLKDLIGEDDMTEGLLLGTEIKRTINTNDEEDNWIKDAKISQCIECLPGKSVILLEYKDDTVVIFPEDFSEFEFIKGIKKPNEINKGILTLIWSEYKSFIKKIENIGKDLAQNIFGREGRFTLEEVGRYFNNFDIWYYDCDIYRNLKSTAFRLYAGRLISEGKCINLLFSNETLNKINLLCEQPVGEIIGEVVFRGLTAVHWEHSFLEFYRCIERLYTAPNARLLKEHINITINYNAISDCISEECLELKDEKSNKVIDIIKDEIISTFNIKNIETFIEKKWPYKEQDTLCKLLCETQDESIMLKFADIFNIDANNIEKDENGKIKYKNLCNNVGGKIYSLRNGIAHFRTYDSRESNVDWDKLINAMCDLIYKLYVIYSEVI